MNFKTRILELEEEIEKVKNTKEIVFESTRDYTLSLLKIRLEALKEAQKMVEDVLDRHIFTPEHGDYKGVEIITSVELMKSELGIE